MRPRSRDRRRFSTRRDPSSFLWDICRAGEAIQIFVRDRSFEDYAADLLVRSAVERQFEVIGEALKQLSRQAPEIEDRIPQARSIIGFRNLLIHGYAAVDDAIVWRTIQEDLPQLLLHVGKLLPGTDRTSQ
ncbi:MAG TPA: HepT-like ribonuclease domain-containing protein [Thermoanaerobaculia bacterium]